MVRRECTRAKSQNSISTAWLPSRRSMRMNGAPTHCIRGGNSGAKMFASAGGRTGGRMTYTTGE